MATLSFTTGVVPVKIACGCSEISRAGRVRAVIARATTDDSDVVARERSDIPEDSRWINPPVPPESMLKDGPKKVRFRDRHRGACESSPTGNEKKKYLALRAGAAARVSFPFPRRDDECARNPDRAPARPSRRVSLATHPLTRSFPFFPFLSSLARADVLGAFLLGAYGEDCARGHRGDGCDARRASPARAIPDYAVNGAMATAGATAAAVFIRATSGRGDALPTPAAALAEAPSPPRRRRRRRSSPGSDSEPEPDVSSLDAKALAIQLLDEIPTWQKALAAGVPATALLR